MPRPMVTEAFNQLGTLSPADRQLFHLFGLGKAIDHPFECVHHAFENQARVQPNSTAVEDLEHTITFMELDRQANCLAVHLRSEKIGPNTRICLLVERSMAMVVGILAVLKAGAAYVLLDGNDIDDKTLSHVIQDSGSPLILLLRKFLHRVGGTPTLCIEDTICNSPSSTHCLKPEDLSRSTDSVYINYMGGAHGVDVMHRNIINLVCFAPGNLKMGHGVRVSQLMDIPFDMAAWEILGSLCNGSTLCLGGKTFEERRTVMKAVDVTIATPSILNTHDPAEFPNLKVVAAVGEPCLKLLADKWAQTASFYNCYGLTEVTIANTMHLHYPGSDLKIGRPTPNNAVYVLDENMNPIKIGEKGIMWAGGDGVTRGYLNLPDKTSEKYKEDPFRDDGSMIFNTGDVVRWCPNGDLEHLGRIDYQVKIKGFRVELDRVAIALETVPGITAATAMLIDGELWGFFTPEDVKTDDVKTAMAQLLPHYSVPTKYVGVDKLPKASDGTLDKWALEALTRESVQVADLAHPNQAAGQPISEDWNKSTASVITYISTTTINTTTTITPDTTLVNLPIKKDEWSQGLDRNYSTKSNSSATSYDTLEQKIELSVLEDQTAAWASYDQDILPGKNHMRFLRNLRHQIFSLYRRMFGIVFLVNVGIFIRYAVEGADALEIGDVVVGNLFVTILMRQDYVIDAFFVIFTSIPPSWPLWIRRIAARVYHVGGLHSGAGVSAVLWAILCTVQETREVIEGHGASGATLTISYGVLILLLLILLFALPSMRQKFHDTFEVTHRYLGWGVIILGWAQIVLLTHDYHHDGPLGKVLVHSRSFWFVFVMTNTHFSLILPWVRLKRVPVYCEKLSEHAVRMYFEYDTPGGGSFVRLSDSPLADWHSFATVTEPGRKGFSLVVSQAGDWTVRQITKPPTHIWKRGIPTYGVMKIAPMFRRLVLVATGAGIGMCMPALVNPNLPVRLLWTAPDARVTFGDKLVRSILEANPEAVIYNTRRHGRPDMVKLTYRLVKEFDAEAVIVISNRTLTEKIVYGMVSRGIPAFGAIWDS